MEEKILMCQDCRAELPISSSSLLDDKTAMARIRAGQKALPEETEMITRSLLKATEDRRRCEAEILRATSLLDQLRRRAERMDRRISTNVAYINPARSLPAEVLEIIFQELCCNMKAPTLSDMETLREGLVLDAYTVARVCRFWRNVALSLPCIWKTVTINVDFLTRGRCEIVDLYMERSRNLEVMLTIAHDPDFFDLNFLGIAREGVVYHMQEYLADNAYRVINLTIFGADPFVSTWIGLPSFNHLRTLKLHHHLPGDVGNFGWLELRPEVAVDVAYAVGDFSYEVIYSVQYITDLTLKEKNPKGAIVGLVFFPELVKLVVELEDGHVRSLFPAIKEYTGGNLSLSNLEDLEVLVDCADALYHIESPVTQFLQMITAPALRELTISTGLVEKWDQDALIDFLHRSDATRLEGLRLIGVPMTEEDLLQILSLLPALDTLQIMEWHDGDTLLTANVLTAIGRMSKLSTLDLAFDHGILWPDEARLVKEIATRTDGPSSTSLKHLGLDVYHRGFLDEEVLAILEGLDSNTVVVELILE